MSDDGTAPQIGGAVLTIDLGANGGLLAPVSAEELHGWLSREAEFWQWLQQTDLGSLRAPIDEVVNLLRTATKQARQAGATDTAVPSRNSLLDSAATNIRVAFLDRQLPHSSTPRGRMVQELRSQSPWAAGGYLWALLAKSGQPTAFDGRDPGAYYGLVLGLVARYGAFGGAEQLKAQQDAFEDLRVKSEQLLTAHRLEVGALNADYARVASEVREQQTQHSIGFKTLLEEADTAHKTALTDHESKLESLRKAYADEMKLRASVSYWAERQKNHDRMTGRFATAVGCAILLLMLLLVGGLALIGYFSPDPKQPPWWTLGALGSVGALGVWAIRLIVRVFLSHQHLATDAAERVVMAQTYLALVAEGKLQSDEERRLVLQPLFRPAADGIVKDEGLPNPVLEVLTRPGKPT